MPKARRALRERIKELNALHGCARLLRDDKLPLPELVRAIATLLPAAFEVPERAAAFVRVGDVSHRTDSVASSPWTLKGRVGASDGEVEVSVSYPKALPFLPEEQALLDSIAEMISVEWRRRQTLAKLEAEQERLKLALRVAEMGIWELDVRTQQVRWSEDLARFIGHTGGDLYGGLFEFTPWIHDDDRDRIRATIAGALQLGGGDRFDLDYRLKREEGGWRHVHGTARVFRDADGQAVRIVATICDVTQRLALEAQARQSRKLEAMGLLAGSVAHDFNNLLSVIMTTSAMLKEELPDGEHKDMVADVLGAGARGVGLAKQLLAFGRKTEAEPSRVLLGHVVSAVEPILVRLLKPTGQLRVEQAAEPLAVWADPGQLDQMLMNLVVNARDAMAAKGGGTVTITTRRVQMERNHAWPDAHIGSGAEVAVTDTGTGIPADVLPRLFEPFFTTKEAGRGTGLGLSVVFGVAKHCNGLVFVDTRLGEGTTFRVQLPLISV